MKARTLSMVACAAVVVVALVLPALALTPVNFDFVGGSFSILGHIIGTAVLAGAIWYCLRRLDSKPLVSFIAAIVAFGVWVSIEGVQQFIPDHGAQVSDMLCDGLGAAVALVVTLVVGEVID